MVICEKFKLDGCFKCFKKEVLRRVNEYLDKEGLVGFEEDELFEGDLGLLVDGVRVERDENDNKKFYEKRYFYVCEEYWEYEEYSVIDVVIKIIEDCGVKIVKG